MSWGKLILIVATIYIIYYSIIIVLEKTGNKKTESSENEVYVDIFKDEESPQKVDYSSDEDMDLKESQDLKKKRAIVSFQDISKSELINNVNEYANQIEFN
ncbi:MAG: hypothetical protein KGV44_08915 [Flavobacteriaceae bacterium]|nr:hypothetical protein [Flavobacteriaceae bacterium]